MNRIFQLLIIACFFVSCESTHHKKEDTSNLTNSNLLLDKLQREKQTYLHAVTINHDSAQIPRVKLLESLGKLSGENKKYAINIYTRIAAEESKNQQSTIADSIFSIAILLAKEYKDSLDYGNIYLYKGNVFRNKSLLDSAIYYYKKTIAFSEKYQDTTTLVSGLTNLASSIDLKTQDTTAKQLLKKALLLCKNNLLQKADINNNLGILSAQKSQLTEAIKYYTNALEIHEQIGNELNSVSTINNLANIYTELGNNSLALLNYNKVYKISKANHHKQYECMALINLGNLYFQMHDLNQSAKQSYTALDLLKDDPDSYYQAILYLNLGILEKEKKKLELAETYLLKSLTIADNLHLSHAFDESKLNLAQLYYEKKNYLKAENYALQVLNSSIEKKNLDFTYQSALLLGNVYRGLKKYSKAAEYYSLHEKYQTKYQERIDKKQNQKFGYQYELQKKEAVNQQLLLNNQLQNQHIEKKEYEIRYQKMVIIFEIFILLLLILLAILLYYRTQTKIKINSILRLKNKEINKSNQSLQEENRFKNQLFSIVSHDIKSPLIALHNFLLLLNAGELSEDEQEEIIGETTAKTEATLNMVEDLLLWTKQQLTDAPAELKTINFHELVMQVLTLFDSTAKEKEVKIRPACSKDSVIYSDPNILKMLIRNLISNSLKFTPKGGLIEIGIEKNKRDFTVSIHDTGNGISEADQSKIFDDDQIHTTMGQNKESGHGLGLKLCKYFIEKNNGKIWFDSQVNVGTTFFVNLPNHSTRKE
ncbi:tetratricopeptide repeat protein [Labilibaculum sp.]|uniref:ATP-binding protein n=1 Tax=Labilibaculum sp. TaxID=2060723 RepID=UPI003566FC89